MNRRLDIDGLRALAVIPVILSHAGFSFAAGGFIGVDVFFVISGFLITGILRDELTAGTYSLGRFYERRARRILPALLFVIAVTCPFAWILMLPDFLQNFGQSVVATILFANNLLLAATSGYWELESGFKPLLHTWSLGVEEQFYLAFPLILAGVWRLGYRWQMATIATLGLLSFAASEVGWRHQPELSFYLPITRAWELMAGAAVALLPRRETSADNVLSAFGLLCIAAAALTFRPDTPSPSAWILLPVIGTVAVLQFGRPDTIAYCVLSTPLLVGIGLISYSAYLWHQPIIAIVRLASLEPPTPKLMCVASALSLLLAWPTWRFIETPFRSRQAISLPHFSLGIVAASAVLVIFGTFLHVTQGLPRRTFPNISSTADVYIAYNERIRNYQSSSFTPSGGTRILVFGNSFARDIANTLIEAGATTGNSLVYMPSNATTPATDSLEEFLSLARSADVVVLAAHSSDDAAHLSAAINTLSTQLGPRLIVFGPKHFGWNLNPYGRVALAGRSSLRSPVSESVVSLNQTLLQSLPDIEYIDLLALLGEDGKGVAVFDRDGNPISADRLHLTRYGAKFLAQRLLQQKPLLLQRFQTSR